MTERPPGMTGSPDPVAGIRDPFAVVPQVLDLVRLNGAIFFRSDFRAPWAYTSPPALELAGALPRGPGSLVMFHVIAVVALLYKNTEGRETGSADHGRA